MNILNDIKEKILNGTFSINDLIEYYTTNNSMTFQTIFEYLDILKSLSPNDIQKFYNCISNKRSLLKLLISLLYLKDQDEIETLNTISDQLQNGYSFSQITQILKYIENSDISLTKDQNVLDNISSVYFDSICNREASYLADVDFSLLTSQDTEEIIKLNAIYACEQIRNYLDNGGKRVNVGTYCEKYRILFYQHLDCIFCNNVSYEDYAKMETIIKNIYHVSGQIEFNQEEYIALHIYFLNNDKSLISQAALSLIESQTPNAFKVDFSSDVIPKYIVFHNSINLLNLLGQEALRSHKKNIKILIDNDLAESAYEQIKSSPYKEMIYVDYSYDAKDGIMSFQDLEKCHRFYEGITTYVERYDFTPFEKYIFCYFLATTLKSYQDYSQSRTENHLHKELPRNKYFILFHQYIVCEGYTNYLTTILNNVKINSTKLSIYPPESSELHSRIMTYLVDPKYNINGVYIGDPTFDSDAKRLKYAFMTKSPKSYNKYQAPDISVAGSFESSMRSLGFTKEECDFTIEKNFEILNHQIPSEVIESALINIYSKIYPSMNDTEIMKIVYKILDDSAIPYLRRDFNYQTKLSECNLTYDQYMLLINSHGFDIKLSSGGNDQKNIYYGLNIFIPGYNNSTLLETLKPLSNQYMKFEYDSYHEACLIKFTFDLNETVADFQRIVNANLQKISAFLGITIPAKETSLTIIKK